MPCTAKRKKYIVWTHEMVATLCQIIAMLTHKKDANNTGIGKLSNKGWKLVESEVCPAPSHCQPSHACMCR